MALTSQSRAVHEFASRLQLRTDLHLARKTWHMAMGMFIALTYFFVCSQSTAILLLGFFLGLDLFLETLRLNVPAVNERVMRHWGMIMRSCERDRLSGVPFYISSSLLAVAIFPKPVAVLSILLLAYGDPIASLVGVIYGDRVKRFASGKSWIGSLAGVLACMAVSLVFLNLIQISGWHLVILTAVAGLAGGLSELLPLELDDNFVIPVVSGFVIWATFILLGI